LRVLRTSAHVDALQAPLGGQNTTHCGMCQELL
jgi:hypothetical protein